MGIIQGFRRLFKLEEKRAHPSSNTNWKLYGFDVGRETASGITIDEESAQGVTVVYACIRAISETVATLPFHLYRKLSDEKRERATDHSLYPIINRKPNPETVDMIFRETMLLHLNTWGNFYANIVYTGGRGGGRIKELWQLRPDRMEVQRVDNEIKYVYTLESGERRLMNKEEILHIPGLGFDGMVGYSPIAKNSEAIALAMAAEEYGARFFQNDARPGVILKHPGELSEPAQDRLRKSWEDMHKGLTNKHRLGILEEGMDLATIGIPPQEAQWIELRKFQLPEICRIYRVPPPIIGDLERSTFSNIQELTEHFAKYCILPWLRRIEQIYNSTLLTDKEQSEYYVEHNMDSMLRANIVQRYQAYATGRQWGFQSANDIRRMENMDSIEGGDIYLSPSNMVPSDMVGKIPPSGAGLGGPDNEKKSLAFDPLFISAIQRIVNRETLALSKVAGRAKDEFEAALEDLYRNKLPGYIREAVGPVIRAYLQAVSNDGADSTAYTENFTAWYVGASRLQIEGILSRATDDNRQSLVYECLDSWKDRKAESAASMANKLQ